MPEPVPEPPQNTANVPHLEWVPKYLEELAINGGQKTKAATVAGTNLVRVFEHRNRDHEFKKLEELAMELAREVAESEARRRAVEGITNIYTTKDGTVREVRTFSDTILLRLLERQETGSWRQKQQLEMSGAVIYKTEAERKLALEKARAIRDGKPVPVEAINGRS